MIIAKNNKLAVLDYLRGAVDRIKAKAESHPAEASHLNEVLGRLIVDARTLEAELISAGYSLPELIPEA